MNARGYGLRGPGPSAWIMIAGIVTFAIGLFVAPDRIWPAWLVSVVLLLTLALAGPVFIAIVKACSGKWADPVVPAAHAMGSAIPLGAALTVFVLFGASTLYPWSHVDSEHVSPLLEGKLGWLNLGSFLTRSVICLGLWIAGASWLARRESRGRSAGFLVLFALTFTVFSFDWIMSLEPEWFSTMFAVYNFAGLILAGIAALTLVAFGLERSGKIAPLADAVRHDLGKLLFAFCFFWGYIWYCQYMLVWYTNMPEETTWFHARLSGSWATMTILSLAVNFLVPFLVLLPAATKRSRYVLARVAVLLLFGRWLDLYVMITPAASPGMPPLGVWEIVPPVAAVVAFLAWTTRRLTLRATAETAPVPVTELP